MSTAPRPVVVAVGSLHYDIMVDAPDRPRKGETVTGFGWRPKFGGKGGNQAIAAARAGADVRMAGAVGDDDFGGFLLASLTAAGVDASRIARIEGHGSGMSVAISDSSGDYGAVIVSGANTALDPGSLDDPTLWRGAGILVLQNEMPDAVNLAAAKAAKRAGVPVCLNAAPHRLLTDEFVALVDIMMVNAIEAEQFCGCPVGDIASAMGAARLLSSRFATVVVTAGADGVVGLQRGHEPVVVPAIPVRLVSTHGAGDVFAGTFAAAFAAGSAFAACLDLANRAAARHVST
ncbi:PfkB family carbohydrate kinase [Mesorhizobium sp. WSM4976]|uniref:PfkB family carbohydrate kinase n=1 Tax=Mesorhizobium sp. WSM4976 TaxID=3038549 RepID=UPI0024159C66|nr:PfkB family carbohydrate kinase [Mesorhizobium sp. WSM4976]MDG4898485.1 PfkB family carbohydrate kinase [Mesorhizobium sp. WSM4976]